MTNWSKVKKLAKKAARKTGTDISHMSVTWHSTEAGHKTIVEIYDTNGKDISDYAANNCHFRGLMSAIADM